MASFWSPKSCCRTSMVTELASRFWSGRICSSKTTSPPAPPVLVPPMPKTALDGQTALASASSSSERSTISSSGSPSCFLGRAALNSSMAMYSSRCGCLCASRRCTSCVCGGNSARVSRNSSRAMLTEARESAPGSPPAAWMSWGGNYNHLSILKKNIFCSLKQAPRLQRT